MKHSIGVITLAAAAVLAYSCTDRNTAPQNTDNEVAFTYHTFDQAYTLENSSTDYETDSDLTMGCRASLFIPVSYMGQNIDSFRDSVMRIAFDTIAENPAVAAEAFFRKSGSDIGYPLQPIAINAGEADSLAHITESLNNFDGFVEVQGRIVALTPEYLSYAITSSSYYPRAAHGMYGTFYIVYSAQANHVVTLSDLFTPEGIAQLPAMLRTRARAMKSYIGATQLNSLPGGDNYYINSDGDLIFSYQPYEIASYAQGQINIDIQPYMVSDYLTSLGKKILLHE